MTDSFQAHMDDAASLEPCWPLSQARDVRSALVNRLCCAVCAVFVCVLSTLPVDFLEFFPGHPKSPPLRQMMQIATSSNSLATAKSEDEDEDAAGGFHRGSL